MGTDSGRISGRADGGGLVVRTGGRADMGQARWADWLHGQGQASWADGQTRTGTLGGLAARTRGEEQMGWQIDERTDRGKRCWMDRPKGKTSQLTHQLTWPLEIQRVCPWVSVKTGHSCPPLR